MKNILGLSLITLPISILIVLLISAIMGSIMGGLSTTIGFPIPYYHDSLINPETNYSFPMIKYLDIIIIYLLITFFYLKIKKP